MKKLVFSFLALVLLVTLSGAQDAAQPVETPHSNGTPNGRIVDGPRNIRRFAPQDDNGDAFTVAIDPATIDLRGLFEHLGEDATEWYQHVQTLANPFFEGRGPGTRGMEIAAEYVEFYLRKTGLEPAFPKDDDEPDAAADTTWVSYRQPFGFSRPGARVEITDARVEINGQALLEGENYAILGNASTGSVTAPVTFVGYGIADGPDGYSSFDEKTDLKGRIALMLRYEPLNDDGKSRWDEQRFSTHAAIAQKLRNLVDRGAAGILLANPPGAIDAAPGLESLERTSRFGIRLTIPAAQLSLDAADQLVRRADPAKRDLMTLRRLADEGSLKTLDLSASTNVTISAHIERPITMTANVGGVLRGRGALADQWIIIGGHYDHLGYGYAGIRNADNKGKLHPGADDNASGTAALLVLAKNLAEDYARPEAPTDLRSVLFIAFSAEEVGLIGSRHFVEHPTFDLSSVDLMFNMDMVGRLRDDNLSVGGTGTAEELMDLLGPHIAHSGLTISNSPSGGGPSDHASFFRAGVPVLFLFTGMHPEYHMPTDFAYTVNPAGAAKVMRFSREFLFDTASKSKKLTFARATGPRAGEDRGYGPVRLGITPGMAETDEPGIVVESVSEGTSAAKAGIQSGDVLLMWNSNELITLGDLAQQLRQHKPGDVVNVTVRRDKDTLLIPVTLQASERRRE